MEKLIRDKIPEIALAERSEVLKIRIASDEDFQKFLKIKLVEEANEVLNATSHDNFIEELADVLEVLKEIAESNKVIEKVFEARAKKFEKNGGFEKKLILEL